LYTGTLVDDYYDYIIRVYCLMKIMLHEYLIITIM